MFSFKNKFYCCRYEAPSLGLKKNDVVFIPGKFTINEKNHVATIHIITPNNDSRILMLSCVMFEHEIDTWFEQGIAFKEI